MKTSQAFEDLVNNNKPKVISQDGFTVKIMFPFAIRYYASGKELTFQIELKQKEGSWWLFGLYWAVYVEVPICWDNEDEPIAVREAELIMDRLKGVLDKWQGKKYKFIPIQAT